MRATRWTPTPSRPQNPSRNLGHYDRRLKQTIVRREPLGLAVGAASRAKKVALARSATRLDTPPTIFRPARGSGLRGGGCRPQTQCHLRDLSERRACTEIARRGKLCDFHLGRMHSANRQALQKLNKISRFLSGIALADGNTGSRMRNTRGTYLSA